MYQLVTEPRPSPQDRYAPRQRLIGAKETEARYGVPQAPGAAALDSRETPSDGIKGISGICAKTAARLLRGGLRLEDLPVSGRLAGRTGQRVLDNLATAMRCRDLARMRTDVPVPTAPAGRPSPALPAPADVVTMLDL